MSASQITSSFDQSDAQHCTRCGIVLPPTVTVCGQCEECVEESIVENGYPEKIILPAKEEIQQPQSASPIIVVEAVSASEEETSLYNESGNTDSFSNDEQDTDDQDAFSKPDTEEVPSTQPVAADLENADSANEDEPDTDDQDAFSKTEELPGIQPVVAEAVHNEQQEDDSTVVLAGSSESRQLEEQAPEGYSATEVFTAVENTSSSSSKALPIGLSRLPSEVSQQEKKEFTTPTKTISSLLKQIKRFILGSQPRINNVVAIIETPMRIQPNKNYTIRIHLIGRDEPKHVYAFKQNNDTARLGGLGSLTHGELVHIEVRSALYHNYAYIVQQADVEVPASNYAAEITIPMRSITGNPGTRRERLHIFFTDEKQNPLYEKPFLIELFISSLVQSGHEGHNILSIPL